MTRYGVALVIAVPKSKLKKCVFFAEPGGRKSALHIKNRGNTDDIKEITSTYINDASQIINSDNLEFCLIMDTKFGLNPYSGIKIIPLIAADQEVLAAFNKKEAALWQKIMQTLPH